MGCARPKDMTNAMNTQLPQDLLELEKMHTQEYRYDAIFCSLVDQGMDPAKAAVEAKARASQPLTYDFGPTQDS
jgi:hypothetical protein